MLLEVDLQLLWVYASRLCRLLNKQKINKLLNTWINKSCKVGQTFYTRGEERLAIVGGIANDDVDSGEEDVSKEF